VITGRGFSEQVRARLLEHPEVASVTLRDNQLSIDLKRQIEIASLVNLLVGAGVQVEEVRKGKASLEEVFLALMEEEQ
jgi:ABC-2 type transport system ATP-binding protein